MTSDSGVAIDHWSGGVIKVELTGQERRRLGAFVRAVAPDVIGAARRDDPTLTSFASQRHTAVLASPRSRLPLWETLTRGTSVRANRATTVRLYRRSAVTWAHLALNAATDRAREPWAKMNNYRRDELVVIACRLMIAATAQRGRPSRGRVPDRQIVEVHSRNKAHGRGAMERTAEQLGIETKAVRAALRRWATDPKSWIAEAVTKLSQLRL